MRFTLPIPPFAAALRAAASAVPAKSTLAILESVLLDFTETGVQITGSDLDMAVTSHAPAKGKTAFSACLPAKRLLALVSEFRDGDVAFEFDIKGKRVTLMVGGGEYVLPMGDHEEYPSLANLTARGKSFRMESDALRDLIGHVLFAVSNDDLRSAMEGVHLRIEDGELVAVATDGHCLSEYRTNSLKTKKGDKFTVPSRAMELARVLLGEGSLEIAYGKNAAAFTQNGLTILTRLIEEEFPDYGPLFPEGGTNALIVNRKAFLASLARVRLFSNSLTHQVRVKLGGVVSLAAEDVDAGGEARETIEGAYRGDAMEMGFNGKYLMDTLKAVVAETVTFRLTTAIRAAVITPEGGDERARLLVMPVRLNT